MIIIFFFPCGITGSAVAQHKHWYTPVVLFQPVLVMSVWRSAPGLNMIRDKGKRSDELKDKEEGGGGTAQNESARVA